MTRIYFSDIKDMAKSNDQTTVHAFRAHEERFSGTARYDERGRLCIGEIVFEDCEAKYQFAVEG